MVCATVIITLNANKGAGAFYLLSDPVFSFQSSTDPAAVSSSQTPSLAQQQCQTADHMLRQIFGITLDVKICLQRIDERTSPTFPLHTDSITLMEGNMELARSSEKNDVLLRDSHSPLVPPTFSVQPLSATPLKNSYFTLNTKPPSALLQKCLLDPFNGTPYDTEPEPDISYVAPIDEDLPSSEENNISASRDAAACQQTCADLTTIIRRVGRMRKRTVCPCCIPATLDPALKSNTRLEETEKWAPTLEETTKKGGRTKAAKKMEKHLEGSDVRALGTSRTVRATRLQQETACPLRTLMK